MGEEDFIEGFLLFGSNNSGALGGRGEGTLRKLTTQLRREKGNQKGRVSIDEGKRGL